MTYTQAAVLGVLVALAIDLFVYRTRLVTRRVWWVSYAIVVFFQLMTNGFLTGRGIVRYNPDDIIGLRIVYAPVEDLLFGFALVLFAVSTWVRLGRVRPAREQAAPRARDESY
ncbi:lycopene cyclase domain-containing protein [Cryptosporangium phraense]|uniref:Lycopene cyclase domain-containing protein n=1 Tax=Cryptosporangium phraense TaxID=2593070 RepID=A0A545AJR0_9ACTN|nr:lycopene cyclase domain-containing protein [Cryptosporangium phraense]TQS41556.1 lycopene cyclase domain-containing protein [Cryptosporangium phraense]